MIKSKALEVNLARTQVDVTIDPRYTCLREVMAGYYGLLERLDNFLREVSHPYKNWQFIVENARGLSLNYFHLFKSHPQGPEATRQMLKIFSEAFTADTAKEVQVDAADNLILFLQTIIKKSEKEFHRFLPMVTEALDFIYNQPDSRFQLFARSYFGLKRLAKELYGVFGESNGHLQALNRLMIRYLMVTYDYWLSETDPLQRFLSEANIGNAKQQLEKIFSPIVHNNIRLQQNRLQKAMAEGAPDSMQLLHELLQLVDHHFILQAYRQIPRKLLDAAGGSDRGNRWKVIFQFQAMNIAGLAINHEDTLRDINRTLNWLITNQKPSFVHNLIQKTFSILKANVTRYPTTALACVDNMGQGIFQTNDNHLIEYFINAVMDLGFQAPMIRGVNNDWQIQVNSAHIINIRTWLNLIKWHPKQSTRLLSNLIIHLAVSGVFIKDTDLFGRDITEFLNSNIGPVFNLAKQLARIFPVYFNDIGAEGELRDISTCIDEICHRRDPLIHFLRKQSHVESSNRIIGFMNATLDFWTTKDKSPLATYLPPNIYARIDTRGTYVDGVHRIIQHLIEAGLDLPAALLTRPSDELKALIDSTDQVSSADRRRIALFAELYKQLNNKYNLNFLNIHHYLDQLSPETFPDLERLRKALVEPDLATRIFKICEYLEHLQTLILSPRQFEIQEDIYKKRHFTVDIPSMYGSYRERKFDAMGLTLRLESLVNVLLEELINTIDLSLITKTTCYQIYDRLMLFNKALRIDGISSAELEQNLDLLAHSLEIRGFSFTQYLDVFKGLAQAVKNIINDYFNNIHGEHLTHILARLPAERILKKYHPAGDSPEPEKLRHRVFEIFLRDRLATSLGLQQLDIFLSRILNTLFHQSSKLPKEHLRRLLNYDPRRTITSLSKPNSLVAGIIFLGNKGLNLLKLYNFGLPIPPAFIITTEVFRCREIIELFKPAQDNFRDQLIRQIRRIEKTTGKCFGDPKNPLLFSVRSGSSISQPGMMETFLNVGMNEAIAQGLAAHSGNAWFAWDNYRRFLQCYGMAFGQRRDDFDAIMRDYKAKFGISLKREFSGDQMKQVAMAYKQRIVDDGFHIPDDPMMQLYDTIQAVMNSWESAKAKSYRQIMGISDDWGTAVNVQAMVFGNLSQHSGSGVIFTHNPRWSGDMLSLWGDFTLGNQGEDVVAGLVSTLPISIKQQEIEMRDTDITLETHFPEIYQSMQRITQDLVAGKGWAPQEMEFTFEGPTAKQLFLLQTRDMGIREHQQVLTFDPVFKTPEAYLGHGIGGSGGAMSGRLVFTLDEMDKWRKKEPRTALILVRGDTVPDDIKEIHAADGLLTARGGVTSHAAVVAHRLGKTCVVGCGNMICDERTQTVEFGQHKLLSGAYISIDGREGSVYQGLMKIKETQ